MKILTKFLMAALAIGLGIATTAQGAGVGFVGAEIDGTAPEWRTSTTAKPYDLDGDDIYGTYAAVHWVVLGTYDPTTIEYNGSGGQYKNPGYPMIDDLSNPASDTEASIALNFHSFKIGSQEPPIIRVGVMHDCLSEPEYAADFGWSASLTQLLDPDGDGVYDVTGNSASSSILPGANGAVDMIFFDLTNVAAGDVFIIEGISNDGRTQNPYIGPVSWDVPEPATMMLIGLGGLTLMRRRRA